MMEPEEFSPQIGVAEPLEEGLRRVVAPNPSPMTWRGTNTYLLGTRGLAVIDPGPASEAHLEAILGALGPGQHISHILVTHTHLDHSPLARPLAEATGAPVLAFGGPHAGRSTVMRDLASAGEIGGGEGVDLDFAPDVVLEDGARIEGEEWVLEALHTPGHIGNHLSFAWGETCFVGDHVMSWASSLVSPPDGDLTDFMASCTRLRTRPWRIFHAGHGAPVTDPAARLDWLMQHRRARELAIRETLAQAPANARAVAAAVYTDTPPALLGAATRNVLAHLIDLYGKSEVEPLGDLTADVSFHLT
jgi:glyoxylase-like metal-dependent hydrolase (beta-lactamase superfamily II)